MNGLNRWALIILQWAAMLAHTLHNRGRYVGGGDIPEPAVSVMPNLAILDKL